MITTVVFDLGGVAARFLPDKRLAALAHASGRSAEDVYRLLWESGFDDDCDVGLYSAQQAFDYIQKAIGLPSTYAGFMSIWASAFEPDQAVLDLISSLRPELKTVLLTNNGPVLLEALATELPAMASQFDECFFACQIGRIKPDLKVFEHVTNALSLEPDQIAFVDDSPANAAAAQRCGWRSLLFQDANQLQTWLADLVESRGE